MSTTATTVPATSAPTTTLASTATIAPTPTTKLEAKTESAGVALAAIMFILISVFAILGIYSLVKSLLCIGKSGSVGEKIFGILLAFFTGPFYLIYLYSSDGYCKDENQSPA